MMPNESFSELYDLPKVDRRHQGIETYQRGNQRTAIWCVGGRDSFQQALQRLRHLCEMHPEDGINQIFLVSDRDEKEAAETLASFEKSLADLGWAVKLKNHQMAEAGYRVEEEPYRIGICPILIPFDEAGALETVLMRAIAELGSEEAYIVEAAKEYVKTVKDSGNLRKHLRHSRQVLKAEYSAVISITNPDRSTAVFDTLLMTYPWEKSTVMEENFGMIRAYLNQ